MKLIFLKTALLHIIVIEMIAWIQTKPLRKEPRLSLVDWTSYNAHEPRGPGTYSFGYDVEDPDTNNIQFRDEERHANGTITGSYGLLQPDGNVHIVHYVADEKGYRVHIETYPRGQLKHVPITTVPSAVLASAIQSKDIYKKQTVHEQRLRPIDTATKPYLQTRVESFLIPVGNYDVKNNIYNTYDEHLNSKHEVTVEPDRFILNRS